MVGNEQVWNPIDAVRRDALAALLRHDVGDLIGARRLADLRDGVENLGTHVGPGLAGLFEGALCRPRERGAARLDVLVLMLAHGCSSARGPSASRHSQCRDSDGRPQAAGTAYQCAARRVRSWPRAPIPTPHRVRTTPLPSP